MTYYLDFLGFHEETVSIERAFDLYNAKLLGSLSWVYILHRSQNYHIEKLEK